MQTQRRYLNRFVYSQFPHNYKESITSVDDFRATIGNISRFDV